MNTIAPEAPVEFVDDRAIPERTPARAFVRALRDHPGKWAKVPSSISTPHLRQIKTYGSYFGVPIELRMKKGSPERWARATLPLTKAETHAARRAGTLG